MVSLPAQLVQIGTYAGGALALIGLVLTIRQLLGVNRAHLFDVYTAVMEMMDNPAARNARHYVYRTSPDEITRIMDLAQKTESLHREEDERAQGVELVMRTMDRLGFLVRNGSVPIEVIEQFYAFPVVKAWVQVEPYVHNVRTERHQPGHMWEFENLALHIIGSGVKSKKGTWKDVAEHDSILAMLADRRTDVDLSSRRRTRPTRLWRASHFWGL